MRTIPKARLAQVGRNCLGTLVAFLIGLILLGGMPSAVAAEERHEAVGRQGMVVSVSAAATEVGVRILRRGGNAVDAAVATAFALAVTHPAAGNIGGGGFMLIAPPGEGPIVVDYRETAPAAASTDMYRNQRSPFGHRVVGVPGTVRGLALAHQRFGKLPWRDVVQPAVTLASEGFVLEPWTARSLNELVRQSGDFPELVRVLGKDEGRGTWVAGDRLRQPDLARTLQRIADEGPEAFYTGSIAEQIVAEMTAGQGLITAEDLKKYQAKWRRAI
ncbi:MAG: gamma-glutamyltransferase, partial [Gemmataceae bacterium]|nr:gamma-glutamyltransferase [Gemmataceae bacterium]